MEIYFGGHPFPFFEVHVADAEEVFDLDRPFSYLDKEFESLFPPEPHGRGVRYVDKLVKVFRKSPVSREFTISEIANFATVSEDFLKKVRASLSKNK